MGRTRLLVSTLAELEQRIKKCEKQKQALLDYIENIKNQCLNNEISYYEYEQLLAKKLESKTVEKWLEEYDKYIEKCKKEIIKIQKKGKRKKIYKVFLSLFIVSAIIFSAFYFRPILVGLIVQEQINPYTQQLDLEFSESQNYEWILENPGNLKSVKISGEILGNGNIKVYLDDYLILDSTNLEKQKSLLTGLAIEESSSDIGEASQEESSPSQAEASPSDNSEPASSDALSSVPSDNSDSSSDISEPAEIPTESTPTEPEGTEIAEPSEPMENATINEPENETIEDITEPTNITEPSNTEPSDTEPSDISKPAEKETRIKFNDICEETCNLDLNKDSYTLRIEVSNANLSLSKIKYEILTTRIGLTPENITEENITANVSPILIQPIPDIQIQKNKFAEIKISNYFQNADEYYLLQLQNISTTSDGSVIFIQPDENFTGARQGKIIASNEFGITESNFFNIIIEDIESLAIENITNIIILDNVTTFQYNAVIGRPVKWKKQIKLNEPEIVKVKLPKQAENIIVNKLEESYSEQGASQEESSPSQQEPPVSVIENNLSSLEKNTSLTKEETNNLIIENSTENLTLENLVTEENVKKEKAKFSINALVVSETDEKTETSFLDKISSFFKNVFRITGRAVTTEEINEELELTIDDNGTEYEIIYETPAPSVFEENTPKGKRIIISGPDELNYTNVLAFTQLPDASPEIVKLYHITENGREEVLINQYDTNEDNLTDYIEWLVPHLSNQTYELEIIILNVKSHPQVGLNWTVSFNTTGMANLTITAYNGTNWSDTSEDAIYDLKFLELKCGNEILEYQWIDNGLGNSSVFIQDYECNETAYEISKVLTEGIHTLEFDFGGTKAYAYNTAGNLNLAISGFINNYNSSVTLKTLSLATLELDAYDFESSPPPSDSSEFVSNITVSGTSYYLEIDAYNDTSNPRTIYLIYRFDATAGAQSGTIDFHWNDLTAGNFTGNFTFYENDSSYTIPNESINMRANNSYSATIPSRQFLYATVQIDEYNSSPIITINAPLNESTVTDQDWALLNWTLEEKQSDPMEVWIYGSNNSDTLGQGNSLLYHKTGLSDDNYTYNWTSQVIQPDVDTVLLFHFDNRSEFGENDANIYDYSNSDNNATSNVTWNETGKFGGAFEFEGYISKDIRIPETGNLNLTNFTIALWFIRRGDGTVGGFTGCFSNTVEALTTKGEGGGDTEPPHENSNWLFGVNSSSNLIGCLEYNGGSDAVTGGTTAIQNDVWYHAVYSVNYTTLTIYLNGNYESSTAINGVVDSNFIPVGIGVGIEDSAIAVDSVFNGSIDELAIWNRTFTPSEVVDLYNLTYQKYYWIINATDGSNQNTTGLYEFTLGSSEDTIPTVTLNSPVDSANLSSTNVIFNCTAEDDSNVTNVTLYGDWTGSWQANETNISEIKDVDYVFTKTITDGNYTWNCEAYDNSSNNSFASSNFTFTIDSVAPLVYLEAPANNTLSTTDNTPEFIFNVTENLDESLDCYLWLRNSTGIDISYGNNDSVLNATSTIIAANDSLANDTYWWWVNCSDGINTEVSEEWNISIEYEDLPPDINFTDPTPSDSASTENTSIEINVSITANDLDEFNYNWNGTNYTIFNDSLVLGFNFDNLSALGECDIWDCLVYDYSGKGNHGSLTNSSAPLNASIPLWNSTGKYNGAFEFETEDHNAWGNSILIYHSDTLNPYDNDFAMMLWFKCIECDDCDISRKGSTDTGSTWYKMEIGGYGTPDLISLQWNTDNNDATMESDLDVCDDNWHFAIGQRIGTNAELWVDAVNQTSLTAGQTDTTVDGSISNTANLTIGSKDTQDDDFMNGTIDEYRLYINRSFSPEEIEILYMSNLEKYDTDKWAFYINQTQNATDVLDEGPYTYSASAKDNAGNENLTETRTITIATIPSIIEVDNGTIAIDIQEGPSTTPAIINFTVYDAGGEGTLDNSTANITLTRSGEATRLNSTCYNFAAADRYTNYTCTVEMYWFDTNGTWDIEVAIQDNSGHQTTNTSSKIEIGELTAFVANLGNLTFPGIAPGAENKTSNNDPYALNNTGNQDIYNISINSTNLLGESDSNLGLWASNFSVDWRTGGDCSGASCTECAGTGMTDGSFVKIDIANITRGDFRENNGSSQEELYFCLRYAGTELSTQAYSTSGKGVWTVNIELSIVMFVYSSNLINRKKSKKKKNRLLQALSLLSEELKEDYTTEKKELVDKLVKEVKKQHKLTNKELFNIIKVKINIPVTIFTKKLGALESVVKYMKENLNMSYVEISSILNRNERTIWTAYNKARKKQPSTIKTTAKDMSLPISIFQNRKLTILESAILYLKKQKLKYAEIASILNRDQRNIWTIYSRAVSKIRETQRNIK